MLPDLLLPMRSPARRIHTILALAAQAGADVAAIVEWAKQQ